ncbi:MAG: ABC transporter permease subunit [Deltaproteobacteria bacterium]|nr:ABC transporter permease subunit [Deltaproteobacteria bacterium]
MKAFWAIYQRELRAYFHSPIAYVLLVAFLALSGYFFFSGVAFYSLASMQATQNPMMMQLNLQDMVVRPLLSNMSIIFMLICPLLTMRLLSEEKKTGTLELLLSYPLTDTSVVLGKYLAACTVFALMALGTWVQMGMLLWLGEPHLPAMLVSYLGLLLVGAAFLALGLWASAWTENQIVAAVGGFVGLLLIWVLGWSASVVGPGLGPVLEALSIGSHFDGFTQGLVDTKDLAYFALFIGLFLFLTIRTLEAKRWKA